MTDLSKIVDGKKYMWDCLSYGSAKDARDMQKKYIGDHFEVILIEEEGQSFLFTRRVVKDVSTEGEPPPA